MLGFLRLVEHTSIFIFCVCHIKNDDSLLFRFGQQPTIKCRCCLRLSARDRQTIETFFLWILEQEAYLRKLLGKRKSMQNCKCAFEIELRVEFQIGTTIQIEAWSQKQSIQKLAYLFTWHVFHSPTIKNISIIKMGHHRWVVNNCWLWFKKWNIKTDNFCKPIKN